MSERDVAVLSAKQEPLPQPLQILKAFNTFNIVQGHCINETMLEG